MEAPENQPSQSGKYRVPALEKGLDILEELAQSTAPQSLTQLAASLNRTSSEIYRMVNYLEGRGYIRREQHSGNYYLSLKLYQLAHMYPPMQSLLTAATIPMEQLSKRVRESCHLSVLRRGQLVVVKQVLSPETISLTVEVGARFPPLQTASGRVMLAYLSTEEQAAFLELDADYQRLSQVDRDVLAAQLAGIRDRGYYTAPSEMHMGISDHVVMVGEPKVGLAAALAVTSLAFPQSAPAKGEIVAAMQKCSQEITKAMGFTNGI